LASALRARAEGLYFLQTAVDLQIAGGVAVDLSECLSTLEETNIDPLVELVRGAGSRTVPGIVGAGRGERR